MLYHAYEMTHAAMSPMRAAARMSQDMLKSPFNPSASWYPTRATSAALEMFIDATRRYGKPEFEIDATLVDGKKTKVVEEVTFSKPFANLLHFKRLGAHVAKLKQPPVIIVAPLSGHFATLLRGTVKAMLPEHDVYITDWIDARDVPITAGDFDLDDYADYIIEMCEHLYETTGERPALMAVCQPGVPVTVAATLMAERKNPARPASVTLMGSPIDTARNPKQPNELATSRDLSWFENNVIVTVPWPNQGFLRRVYPGFLQLSGFMSMNLDRHVDAHTNHFRHLIRGDGENAASHRKFYDEYLAVMDMTAEFYLQTIERVFQKRALATGQYHYRGTLIEPSAVRDIAFFTVEGEKDDITGIGQTSAVHDLLTKLPKSKKSHHEQEKVGHYGVFNGSRWRDGIQPRVRDFIAKHRLA